MIQLSKDNYNGSEGLKFPGKGAVVRITGQKRLYLQVQEIEARQYEHKLTMIPVYKPSPKSRLKKKSSFSKVKVKIIK